VPYSQYELFLPVPSRLLLLLLPNGFEEPKNDPKLGKSIFGMWKLGKPPPLEKGSLKLPNPVCRLWPT
jgi:hypothetical protein